MFSLRESEVQENLVRCVTHDSRYDAQTYGAYSYVPVGAMDVSSALSRQ